MYAWNPENERLSAEAYLLHRQTDFVKTYMEVSSLQHIVDRQPEIVQPSTAEAFCSVLRETVHIRQRQVYFLFKKAADGLAAMLCAPTPAAAALKARGCLAETLAGQTGHALRAAAEAMGALPLSGNGKGLPEFPFASPEIHPLHDIADVGGMPDWRSGQWMGRSLIFELTEEAGRLLVFKFARSGQPLSELAGEAEWIRYLSGIQNTEEWEIPCPVPLNAQAPVIYRLSGCALQTPENLDIDPARYAIAFKAPQSYFCYPNHPAADGKMLSKSRCRTVLAGNARIFGRLAARGIIHTAPIPLFHNRVQRHRRQDQGLYQWHRGGRLDQWLTSCRYPNLCRSGIRDFEHFIAFDGPARSFYQLIGTHAFSLVLVAGSYCRNHDPERVGRDGSGRPVDARDLFDPVWMKQVLADIFSNYYEGFTGERFAGDPPCDLDRLSRRLVEEMGVDRHMEETLRVAEQDAMTPAEFRDFLMQRGYDKKAAEGFTKGQRDIHVQTGPHLGGFNEHISVPELTEYTAALCARAIMDRFCRLRFAGAEVQTGKTARHRQIADQPRPDPVNS